MAVKRLTRSSTDKMLGGVCGGLGRYAEVDSTWVRLAFVLLLFAGGSGLIIYIAMYLVVPLETTVEGAAAPAGPATGESAPVTGPQVGEGRPGRGTLVLGLGLVVAGVLFLASNLGLIAWWRWEVLWPLALILCGLALLARRTQR